jgi:hypothetical protein
MSALGFGIPSPNPPFTPSQPATLQDVIYRALRSAHVTVRPKLGLAPSRLAEILAVANQLADEWAARRVYQWTTTFNLYTLTPNHEPHLIGPGLVAPDFPAPWRPVRIENAALVLTGNGPVEPAPNPPANPPQNVNTNVDLPLNIRDANWWAANRVKGIATNVPTDLYYEPDWDSGQLWLWPVPSFAYGLRLNVWAGLTPWATVQSPFSAPPGYFKAFALTLAEELPDMFEVAMPAGLAELARRARMAVQGNNNQSPRIASADFGTRTPPKGDWNYFSGGPSGTGT